MDENKSIIYKLKKDCDKKFKNYGSKKIYFYYLIGFIIFVPSFFIIPLLYLEITFWFNLNTYLSKILWNATLLNYNMIVLKILEDQQSTREITSDNSPNKKDKDENSLDGSNSHSRIDMDQKEKIDPSDDSSDDYKMDNNSYSVNIPDKLPEKDEKDEGIFKNPKDILKIVMRSTSTSDDIITTSTSISTTNYITSANTKTTTTADDISES
ncbi:hypothetical protein C1645_738752 [Glomus cerebriforme]|uniref:Uncharacterized protein n=1 Tax=Glomus cerebriforme TaxID=658196 RepID=A0A397SWE5_9GLOM|nr:hypothetical protein C1645_738752 [Glomus cerebriforme]